MKKTTLNFIDIRQQKTAKIVWLGWSFLILSIITSGNLLQFGMLFGISMLLIGYRISYRVSKDFENKKVFSFLNIPIIKTNLSLVFPEYISIFEQSQISYSGWGPVSAIGANPKSHKLVIRFFNKSDYDTVYVSDNALKVEALAYKLKELLQVELIDNRNK